jgi:hypothetical protein
MENVQKLARTMSEIRSFKDVKNIVGKRREAWNAVNTNKNGFLRAVNETVIGPARSSNYSDPSLTRGTCDDCRHLKEERDSLAEA